MNVARALLSDAVRGGLLSLEEACQRYKLTTEEFLAALDENLQRRLGA